MYGLVLAGGGAKGAFQIGVWRALKELEIEVGLVCGTSVGALNGALFAQNQYDEALAMWQNINMSTVFDADTEILDNIDEIAQGGISKTNLQLFKKAYDHVVSNKGLNVGPLREMISNLLNEDLMESTGIEFGFVTLSITDRKPLRIFASEIPKGELKYYLLGSALVPGFNQDENHPLKFIDGGVYDNFPIKMAIEKGYKDIIAVQLFNKREPKYKDINLTYIKPSENLGNFLYFEQEKSLKNIEMGYLDALKAFNKVEGINYYFEPTITENNFINSLQRLNKGERQILKDFFSIKQTITQRILFEKVVPKLNHKLGLSSKDSYKDLLYGLLEYLLKKEDMNRLKKYDPKELVTEFSSVTYKKGSTEELVQIFIKNI